ncbi:MAG: hypothetical protein IT372_19165 [Polyangiaceae bacterium]|nr:hypothetical protein [Polyangiaceae bacterium]
MSADKPVKRKRKASGTQAEGRFLRLRSDPRSERRYEPKSSPAAYLTMLGGSIGALVIGAGVYGQWMRAEELGPHPYAPYLLAAGAAIVIAALLFGSWGARPVRVGDAGVASEKGPGEIERIAWCDVTRVLLSAEALTIQAAGASISIPLRVHPAAAARALAEARARVPSRAGDVKEGALPAPDDGAGEVLQLDPPQVAGQRCKATDKLIAFEEDARLCGRCGELFHKDGVPKSCATCDAPLRA